ncbi:MAG: hypothetical protein ACO3C1_12025 [Ilumatobacteraceae bacterium]
MSRTMPLPSVRRLAGHLDRPWRVGAVGAIVLGLPLLVAAAVLRGHPYHPVLDLAMTELRVRDVGGRHTPLVGLPGRIGHFPDQGSHPGPLSFYVVAFVYRLLGSSAWAMLCGAIAVHLGALGAAVALAFRRGGWRLVGAVSLWLLVVMRGYGIGLLEQPWNPYLPLMAWTVVLLAFWAVLDGDHRALLPLVVAGTLAAQTHVPYLVLCGGTSAVALVVVARRVARMGRPDRRQPLRSLVLATGVGVLLWLPPLVDQVLRTPGNIRMLIDHFSTPDEPPIGVRHGLAVLLRHLDVVRAVIGRGDAGGFVQAAYASDRSTVPGAIFLGVWTVAAVASMRLPSRPLRSLHRALAVVVTLQALSMVRIFGKVWYYLTLWAWSTTVLMAAAVAATVACAVGVRARRAGAGEQTGDVGNVGLAGTANRSSSMTTFVGACAALACAGSLFVDAARSQPPEPRLSDQLGALVAPTVAALRAGTGAATGTAGTYMVTWSDAFFFGSQGYGLVVELERNGLRAGADDPFRVPITAHRVVRPSGATARVHLATGVYIEMWRAVPGAVEVAVVDLRTDAERAEFDRLRTFVLDRLAAQGLDDVAAVVDTNLFGASLDERLDHEVEVAMARMLIIGEPAAVFVVPIGVEPA